MAKYIIDVSFDVPKEVLVEIPDGDTLSKVSSNLVLTRFDKSKKPGDECSSARISLEGSDSWCQKQARQLTITVTTTSGPRKFKSQGFEIVHCQS
jgi:hypothetical protein